MRWTYWIGLCWTFASCAGVEERAASAWDEPGATFGHALAVLEDPWEDGVSELAVSEPWFRDPADEHSRKGRVFVFDGATRRVRSILRAEPGEELFGWTLAAGLPHAERPMLVVGALRALGPTLVGIDGRSGERLWERSLPIDDGSAARAPRFVDALTWCDDVDLDGWDDFAVARCGASPQTQANHTGAKRPAATAARIEVRSSRSGVLLHAFEVAHPGRACGCDLVCVDDVNDDFVRDLAVASGALTLGPASDVSAPSVVELYSGLDGRHLRTYELPRGTSHVALRLAAVADLDGDCGHELLVSCPAASSSASRYSGMLLALSSVDGRELWRRTHSSEDWRVGVLGVRRGPLRSTARLAVADPDGMCVWMLEVSAEGVERERLVGSSLAMFPALRFAVGPRARGDGAGVVLAAGAMLHQGVAVLDWWSGRDDYDRDQLECPLSPATPR